jgi:hypothetical protein
MPRHVVVLEGAYGMIQDFGYSVGDAEDWVTRNQADFSDWADNVAMGLMSVQEMKRRMNEQFANASKQIGEARALMSANGRRMGFSHLHESLRDLDAPKAAGIRLALPYQQQEGA